MVFDAFSKEGKLPFKLIDRGAKINQELYLNEILKSHVKPHADTMFGDRPYIFQQDSAPLHKAKTVQVWCEKNFPCFIPVSEWSPSSPDLNPLDLFAWCYMLEKLKNVKCNNLNDFKVLLVKICDEIPDELVHTSCDNFFKRVHMCIKEKGERFEIN